MSRSSILRTTNETNQRDLARRLHKIKRRLLLEHVEQQEKALARVAAAQQNGSDNAEERLQNKSSQTQSQAFCTSNKKTSSKAPTSLTVSATNSRNRGATRVLHHGSSSSAAACARRE